MTSIELNAYCLVLKNGTLDQVFNVLYDINELEAIVPEKLLAAIIAMLRDRGIEVADRLMIVIQMLIGKTKSIDLYRVADELRFLDRGVTRIYLNGKVDLFVNRLFFLPELEIMVIDELQLWLTYIEQVIRQRYMDELPASIFERGAEYDPRLKGSEMFGMPLYPVRQILSAFEKIGSSHGRESLLALEYLIRPRLNDYLAIEYKWDQAGDERAWKEPSDENAAIARISSDSITVCHLKNVVNRLSDIGRSAPLSMSPCQVNSGQN